MDRDGLEGPSSAERNRARIAVVGGIDREGVAAEHRAELPAPLLGNGAAGVPVVPSAEHMSLMLDSLKDIDQMRTLHEEAAAWEEATKRMQSAFEVVAGIAEFRIRLERRIGAHLAKTVRRGGRGSRAGAAAPRGGASAGLPQGFSKQKASRYRRIASVGDEVVEHYIARARERMRLPSSNGLLSFAFGQARGAVPKGKRRQTPMREASTAPAPSTAGDEDLQHVWQVVKEALDVSVAVGVPAKELQAAQEFDPDNVLVAKLRGNVVVRADQRVDEWLVKLNLLRVKRQVSQAIVFFHASTAEPWFHLLDEQGWTCCFVRGPGHDPTIVAYLGDQHRAVGLKLEALGTVLRGIGAATN